MEGRRRLPGVPPGIHLASSASPRPWRTPCCTVTWTWGYGALRAGVLTDRRVSEAIEALRLVSPAFLPAVRCDFSHARKGKLPFSRVSSLKNSVEVSDIFYFFCSGEGKGGPGRQGAGGAGFLLKSPGGGGGSPTGGRGARGAGRVSVGNWGGGVEAKYFFRGRNVHQEKAVFLSRVGKIAFRRG